MKNIIQSFRYLKGHYHRVAINAVLAVAIAVFEILSIALIIPFLDLILNKEKEVIAVDKPGQFSLFPVTEIGAQVEQNFNYWFASLIENNTKLQMLTMICIVVFVTFLIKNFLIYINRLVERSVLYNVAREQRQKLYEKVLRLPMSQFSEQRRGDILTRFSNDILKLESSVLNGFLLLFKEPVTILFYIGAMLLISPKLTLFIFILIPTLGLVIGRISRSLKRSSTKYQEKLSILISYLDETMFGAKVIKAFNGEFLLNERFTKDNFELKKIHKKIHIRKSAASPVSEILGMGLVMIVLWYGGSLVLGDNNSGLDGQLLLFYILLFARLITPVKALSNQYSILQDGLASGDRLDAFLASEEEFETLPERPTQQHDFKTAVVFDNVSFSYPKSEKIILDQLNLVLSKGTVTALVGQSGAGKSTIADLLPRFFSVTNGAIKIDGQNINDFALQDLRNMFSYVSQEAILFNETIKNNIAFGREGVNDEEIIRAAKIANAHDFILGLENGYNTNVGERGSKLSGGQKQRITIARAILKDAPFLILDEATSALDTESERLVQDAIERLLENRTALVIAHRLSTIKNADKICVIDNGQIIEQGSHEELIQNENGHYKLLTELQAV